MFPYLQVFNELIRYLSHAPIGLPHLATEDTHIDQYFIPKNTQVICNVVSTNWKQNLLSIA